MRDTHAVKLQTQNILFLFCCFRYANKRCVQWAYIQFHCAVSYKDKIILKISIKSPYNYLRNGI